MDVHDSLLPENPHAYLLSIPADDLRWDKVKRFFQLPDIEKEWMSITRLRKLRSKQVIVAILQDRYRRSNIEIFVDHQERIITFRYRGTIIGNFHQTRVRQSVDAQTATSPSGTRDATVVDNYVWCLHLLGVKRAKYPIFAGVLRFAKPKQLPDVRPLIPSVAAAFRHPNGTQPDAASA